MTLNELIEDIKELALAHDQVISFHVGETFDIATSKSTERYPAVWFELPILTYYDDARKKTHGMALEVITLAKSDDITDQMEKTSDMEAIGDDILQAIGSKFQNIGLTEGGAVTLRGFSDDDLVGVRIELTLTVGRECDYKSRFNTVI